MLFVLLGSAGCGKRKPTAIDVAAHFQKVLIDYARTGYGGYRAEAFEMLTDRSKSHLAGRARELNENRAEGVPEIDAQQLLLVRRILRDSDPEEVRYEDDSQKGAQEVVVVLEYPEGEDRLRMVFEGGAWKVDLFAPGTFSQ